jgi:putative pyruvate formate lyase activating enzyme
MKKGVIVRHLLMPGMLIQAKLIVKYLYDQYGDGIYLSLMNQYTPFDDRYPGMKLPDFLKRKLPQGHYDAAAEYLLINDQTNAYVQEDASGDELLPDFNS